VRAADQKQEPGLDAFKIPSSAHVRLHQNESPYASSPAALRAAREALEASSRYPDSGSPDLCRCLADHYGVDPAMVAVGAGSGELILAACRAWAAGGRRVVVSRPGFPGYEMMAGIVGAPVRTVACDGYRIDVDAMIDALPGAGCMFVCNPLNPTGTVLRPGEVSALAEAATGSGSDGVLVMDEAYAEFAGEQHCSGIDEVRAGRSVVVLRTFSKAYGLAGLRAGYAIAPPALIAQLRRWRPPFTVNRPAQAAAAAALADQAFLRLVVERVADGRRSLADGLSALGFGVVASHANFVLASVPDGGAGAVARGLEDRSFLVQDVTGFGLPDHVRITVGTASQNAALLRTLAELRG
jgi:histidinol-phosphate aminotransferase